MRSLCAIALLASCGLCVPAKRASIPAVSSLLFRTFSPGSAVDGLSAHALEMQVRLVVLTFLRYW